MIVRVGMAARAPGLSYEEFAVHWRTRHAEIASKLPGLRSYLQNHAVLSQGRPLLPYPGFDACSQFEFDDLAAMDATFASVPPDGELRHDELRLIDPFRRMGVFAQSTVTQAGDAPGSAVKLMTFLRVAPGAGLDDLVALYDEAGQDLAPASGSILRRERLTVLSEAHEGRVPPWCDLIDVVTLPDVEAALGLLSGTCADEAGWRLSGVGQVVGRRIASEVWVVRPLKPASLRS
jgi:uncharacterized protein (TIGR02118 family)